MGEISARADQDAAAAKILVVDDDPRNRLAAEAALADLGVPLTLVSSGSEALRELLDEDYALILLDVNMPQMDGFETARRIRARDRNRSVPIILVTAYRHDEADIYRGYQLGAVDYLFKPVVPEVLRAKASFFLELRARTRQLAEKERQLREAERLAAERRLEEERRSWEAERLAREMEEQRRVNTELEAADRAKDEFIAMLAHELRNPLAPIVMAMPLMKPVLEHDVGALRAWEAVRRQTEHLARLLDDLLDVSRIARGKITLRLQTMDVRAIVSRGIETCRPVIDKRGHELTISAPAEPVWLSADPLRLTQVVQNLLHNAARYTPPGGRIDIRVEPVGDMVSLRIRDNGRGMPPELLSRVFDSFVQERDGGRGLGLGLSLVKDLVVLHGGTVEARSDGVGKGTEMLVRLPLVNVVPETQTVVPQDVAVARSKGLRIVLIEDEEDIRDVTSDLFEQWGHRVFTAASGREGVDLVVSQTPDVAIVDIGLPDIDGCEVARRICAELGERRPQLVALSGYGQDRDRDRSAKAGFDVHLVKPAMPEELERTIMKLAHRA